MYVYAYTRGVDYNTQHARDARQGNMRGMGKLLQLWLDAAQIQLPTCAHYYIITR